jgi:hypothetical protein
MITEFLVVCVHVALLVPCTMWLVRPNESVGYSNIVVVGLLNHRVTKLPILIHDY